MEPLAPQNVAPKKISPQCAYYYRNRETILMREKEKKRWIKYYAEHKDAVKQRRQRNTPTISTDTIIHMD